MNTISPVRMQFAPQVKPATAQAVKNTEVKFGSHHNSNTISVTGTGFVSKDPDVSTMSLSVQEIGANRDAVKQAVATKANAIMNAINALNVDFKLKSGGVSVQEHYVYNRKTNENEQKGFRASFSLQVTEKSSKIEDLKQHASQVNEIAVQNGGNFGGAHGSLSPRRSSSAEREALAGAYSDAFKKASKLSKAAGFALDAKPVSVVENGAQAPVSNGRAMRAMALGAAPEAAMADSAGEASENLFQFAPITVYSPTISVHYQLADAPAPEGKKPLDIQG